MGGFNCMSRFYCVMFGFCERDYKCIDCENYCKCSYCMEHLTDNCDEDEFYYDDADLTGLGED